MILDIAIAVVCAVLVFWYSGGFKSIASYHRTGREIKRTQEVNEEQAAKNAQPNTSAIVKRPHETE